MSIKLALFVISLLTTKGRRAGIYFVPCQWPDLIPHYFYLIVGFSRIRAPAAMVTAPFRFLDSITDNVTLYHPLMVAAMLLTRDRQF
jgi:hypothetical protein